MYTRAQQQRAWRADLVEFLPIHHADQVVREGRRSCRLAADHKVVFRGNSYFDNGDGSHGGPIDALVKYFDYTPYDAIIALSGGETVQGEQREKQPQNVPQRYEGRFSRVFAYLAKTRRINQQIIIDLMKAGLLYEDTRHNAVFINKQRTMAEIRGTGSTAFKSKWGHSGYWFYQPNNKSERVYITESAIDAISLFQILGDKDAVYVSLGGVGNARRIIDSIAAHGKRIVICTDTDAAGMQVRADYPMFESLLPINKDWNEDITKGVSMDEIYRRNEAVLTKYIRLQKTA